MDAPAPAAVAPGDPEPPGKAGDSPARGLQDLDTVATVGESHAPPPAVAPAGHRRPRPLPARAPVPTPEPRASHLGCWGPRGAGGTGVPRSLPLACPLSPLVPSGGLRPSRRRTCHLAGGPVPPRPRRHHPQWTPPGNRGPGRPRWLLGDTGLLWRRGDAGQGNPTPHPGQEGDITVGTCPQKGGPRRGKAKFKDWTDRQTDRQSQGHQQVSRKDQGVTSQLSSCGLCVTKGRWP